MSDWPDVAAEVRAGLERGELWRRQHPDGRCVVVLPLLFGGARIGITTADYDDGGGFNDVWDYTVAREAIEAATMWDPAVQEAPCGWSRHPGK